MCAYSCFCIAHFIKCFGFSCCIRVFFKKMLISPAVYIMIWDGCYRRFSKFLFHLTLHLHIVLKIFLLHLCSCLLIRNKLLFIKDMCTLKYYRPPLLLLLVLLTVETVTVNIQVNKFNSTKVIK